MVEFIDGSKFGLDVGDKMESYDGAKLGDSDGVDVGRVDKKIQNCKKDWWKAECSAWKKDQNWVQLGESMAIY